MFAFSVGCRCDNCIVRPAASTVRPSASRMSGVGLVNNNTHVYATNIKTNVNFQPLKVFLRHPKVHCMFQATQVCHYWC